MILRTIGADRLLPADQAVEDAFGQRSIAN
jgi:hypothetical protein